MSTSTTAEGRASGGFTPRTSQPVANVSPSETSGTDWVAEFPPARSLPLDQEALRLFEHAYAIGLRTEPQTDPAITFSTLLMALFVGQDETSRWFRRLSETNGPRPEAVFAEKKIAVSDVQSLSPRPGKPEHVRLSRDRHLLTTSARTILQNAERWVQRVRGSDIGVRHLVAAYVINPPPAHHAQMQRWNFQATSWRTEFFPWVASRYTAEQWIDTQFRPAPTKGADEFEQVHVKAAALAFPGDESTMAVLERSAAYHARSRDRDRFLRVQTLFCALVETARQNPQMLATVQPIWEAVTEAGETYARARDELFPPSVAEREVTPFAALDISSRVLNSLETARELALATRHEPGDAFRVRVLQLAGALVSSVVEAEEELSKFGVDGRLLRERMIEHAETLGEWGDVWREAIGDEETHFVGRPVDLSSDEPEATVRRDEDFKDDALRIKADVETFASLLASSTLEPPLSIGLFGPWGSGKTTFLKRLRRAVDNRATEARAARESGEPTSYVSNIVHVEFNAWHFAETALTSSLVDTIFRSLNAYVKDEQPVGGKTWRELKLSVLASTERKLEAAQAVEKAAAAAVVKAEEALVRSRATAAARLTSVQSAAQDVWNRLKKQLEENPDVRKSGLLAAVGDTVRSVDELRAKLTSIRTRPARLIGALGWTGTIVFAVLVLAVPPFVAWLVGRVMGTGQMVQLMSSATAALSVIGTWVRAARDAASKVDVATTQVLDEYEKRVTQDPTVVTAQAELDAAQASAETASAGVRAAREELARARADAANATLPAQMLQLVSSRIDAQTYTKELTTLSLARSDLQALSTLLRTPQNGSSGASQTNDVATSGAPRAVDRVILYIDDLDRCKPEDVVRVLQLVHMLLAFELFAVVVAVDARWVYASLAHSYHWLARDGNGVSVAGQGDDVSAPVTPQDYLEKIFQIVFWLEPMNTPRAAKYLRSLVPVLTRTDGPVYEPVVADAAAATGESAEPSRPGKVGIAGIELDYMRALAAHVGTSPRRVKRLVNAYRLIKAGLSDAQLRTFLTNGSPDDGDLRSGPYQIVIGLLVISTGVLGSSAQILAELSSWDPTASWSEVIDSFRARNDPDWTRAAQVLEIVMGTQKPNDVGELRGWAGKVSRYLLSGPAAKRLTGELESSAPIA